MTGKSGFTLVELLIVVAIIGLLAALAIPQFTAYRVKGYQSPISPISRSQLALTTPISILIPSHTDFYRSAP